MPMVYNLQMAPTAHPSETLEIACCRARDGAAAAASAGFRSSAVPVPETSIGFGKWSTWMRKEHGIIWIHALSLAIANMV